MKRIKYFKTFESIKSRMEYEYNDFLPSKYKLKFSGKKDKKSEASDAAENKFKDFFWKAHEDFYRHEHKRFLEKEFLTESEFDLLSEDSKFRYVLSLIESKIKLNKNEAEWYSQSLKNAGYDVPEQITKLAL